MVVLAEKASVEAGLSSLLSFYSSLASTATTSTIDFTSRAALQERFFFVLAYVSDEVGIPPKASLTLSAN